MASFNFNHLISIILAILLLIINSNAQISVGSTVYDGVTSDDLPSYYTLNGQNGIRGTLQNRTSNNNTGLNYFIRMWVRPQNNFNQSSDKSAEVLFDINKSFRCQFQFQNTIACYKPSSTNQDDFIYLQRMNNSANMWVHIVVAGSKTLNRGYIRADYGDQTIKTTNTSYLSLIQGQTPWYIHIGITSTLTFGLIGDIREFLITEEYINPNQVPLIKNQYLSWNLQHLAYFRFQKGSLIDVTRNTMLATTVQMISTQTPKLSYDTLSNDICYPYFGNIIKLPQLDSLTTINTTIDSRMRTNMTAFQYSGSFWIRAKAGITASASYNANLVIFQLKGVFSLWFTSTNFIKMRIHATKAENERDSTGIYIPLDEWINVQIMLNQSNGYQLSGYSSNRRLYVNVRNTTALQAQTAGSSFILFQNFKGYIKSVLIYQQALILPIYNPQTQSETIKNDSLILYYNFGEPNFKSQNSLGSLALTSTNVAGTSVVINGPPKYDFLQFDDNLVYSDISTLYGQLNQTQSLFDGVSCNTSKSYVKLKGLTSNIQIKYNQLADLNESTLEFWFKRGSATTTQNFIAQLALDNSITSQTYFSIYQDQLQANLMCQIQNSTSLDTFQASFQTISLSTVDQITYQSWQHIACKFKSNFEATAIHTISKNQELIKVVDIGYNTTITMKAGNYTLILGNSREMNKGLVEAQIREVRYWNYSRSVNKIRHFAFTQINPLTENYIVLYYRLLTGDMLIQNYPLLPIKGTVSYAGLEAQFENSSFPTLLLCPMNSYHQSFQVQPSCYKNLFLKQNLKLIALYDAANDTVSWQITPLSSDMLNEFTINGNLSYLWQSNNKTMTQLIANISNQYTLNDTLYIPNSYINQTVYSTTLQTVNTTNGTQSTNVSTKSNVFENKTQQVYVQTQNKQGTFIQTSVSQYRLNPCRYVIDQSTLQPINEITYYDLPGYQDIVLYLQVKTRGDCSIGVNETLIQSAQLEVYPERFGVSSNLVSYQNGLFKLNFTKSEQLKVNKYQKINFVISIQWANNSDPLLTPIQETTINAVYQLKFVEKIVPILDASRLYPQSGENLILNATASRNSYQNGSPIPIINNYQAINYKWICPQIFQAICLKQQYFKVLNISSLDFNNSGAELNTPFIFKIELRSQKDPYNDNDTLNVFVQQVTITFVSYEIPDFSLNIYQRDKVYVLEDNSFLANITNFIGNRDLLQVIWTITPPTVNGINDQVYNAENTQLIIQKGGLLALTQYTIKVDVVNINRNDSSTTHTLTFQTGVGNLTLGELSIDPMTGYADVTNFEISIQNFVSDYLPVTYEVFGQQYTGQEPFKLSSNTPLQAQSTFSGKLPELQKIQVTVKDSIGNSFTLQQDVSITIYDGQAGQNETMDDVTTQMFNYFTTLESSAETAASQQSTIPDTSTLESKMDVAMKIFQITTNFGEDSNNNLYNRILLQKSQRMLRLLTNNTFQLNNTIATIIFDIYQHLQYKTASYSELMLRADFTNDQLQTLSGLAKYTNEKIDFLTDFRRVLSERELYQNNMQYQDFKNLWDSIYSQRQLFQQQYCSKIQQFERQLQLNSYSFNLIFEKYQMNSTLKYRAFNTTTNEQNLIINVEEMIDQLVFNNLQSSNYCLVSVSQRIDPLNGESFVNQSYGLDKFKMLDLINSEGVRVNSQVSSLISGDTENPFIQIAFYYDFTQQSSNFKRNQTVCMTMPADPSTDYTNLLWQSDYCETEYHINDNYILCKCQYLRNDYYGIIKDTTRLIEVELLNEDDENVPKFNYYLIILLAFLGLFLILFPIVGFLLDRRDYKRIASNFYNLDPQLLVRVARMRYKPVDIISYRQDQLAQYQKLKKVSRCTVCCIICRNQHPFLNLMMKFDVTFRRLMRVFLCSIQQCSVALVALVFFKIQRDNGYYQQSSSKDSITSQNVQVAVYLGLICSILLLPLPKSFISCLLARYQVDQTPQALQRKRQMEQGYSVRGLTLDTQQALVGKKDKKYSVVESDDKTTIRDTQGTNRNPNIEPKIASKVVSTKHDKFKQPHQTTMAGIMKDEGNQESLQRKKQGAQEFDIYTQVKISGKNSCIKIFVMLFAISYLIGIIVALVLIGLNLEPSYQFQIVISFFVALLVNWFILNPLKIILVSCVLQKMVSKVRQKNNKECWVSCCQGIFTNQEQISLIKDMLIVLDYKSSQRDIDHQIKREVAEGKVQKQKQFEKPYNQEGPGDFIDMKKSPTKPQTLKQLNQDQQQLSQQRNKITVDQTTDVKQPETNSNGTKPPQSQSKIQISLSSNSSKSTQKIQLRKSKLDLDVIDHNYDLSGTSSIISKNNISQQNIQQSKKHNLSNDQGSISFSKLSEIREDSPKNSQQKRSQTSKVQQKIDLESDLNPSEPQGYDETPSQSMLSQSRSQKSQVIQSQLNLSKEQSQMSIQPNSVSEISSGKRINARDNIPSFEKIYNSKAKADLKASTSIINNTPQQRNLRVPLEQGSLESQQQYSAHSINSPHTLINHPEFSKDKEESKRQLFKEYINDWGLNNTNTPKQNVNQILDQQLQEDEDQIQDANITDSNYRTSEQSVDSDQQDSYKISFEHDF
eukprot:403336096